MGRPSFEKVGVTFTKEIEAFELMKLRILNGGHPIISYPGALLDMEYVHEPMGHQLIRDYFIKLEQQEIIPVVPPVPGTDLQNYFVQIQERFSNPEIGDTIPRICMDGSNRQPKFILPSIKDRLNEGLGIKGLSLEIALCRKFVICVSCGQHRSVYLRSSTPSRRRFVRSRHPDQEFHHASDQ